MSDELNQHDDFEQDLPEQIAVRLAKRDRLNELGEAYPVSLPITHTIEQVRAAYPSLEIDVATGDKVAIAGRVMFQRNTGKLCFATLQAGGGERIQAMLSLDKVGGERLELFKELIDLGDHLFVAGEVITSKRGELSILVDEWQIAAKTIRPLPNLHNELGEEYRVRHRYIDLIVRDRAREVVQIRAQVMKSLRNTFDNERYIEVETPMLQTMHGGASARPFKTHALLSVALIAFSKSTATLETRVQTARTRQSLPCLRPTRHTVTTTPWQISPRS